MNITRRTFLRYTLMGLIASQLPCPAMGVETETYEDEKIFAKKIKLAKDKGLFKKPLDEIMITIGKSFIGTPYVADTLDSSGKEALVTNLHGLDCWTFFENTLDISRVIKKGKNSFEDYKKEVEFTRYRGGIRKNYVTRLHYFIDWIYDNVQKGVVKDINKEVGGVRLNKKIDFMGSHRDLYPPLSSDECFNELKEVEKHINSRDYYYIPTKSLPEVENSLKMGDIFGFITEKEGLDVSHTGLIYKEKGYSYILDAASSIGYVDISGETLYDYLNRKGFPGVIIARPV